MTQKISAKDISTPQIGVQKGKIDKSGGEFEALLNEKINGTNSDKKARISTDSAKSLSTKNLSSTKKDILQEEIGRAHV